MDGGTGACSGVVVSHDGVDSRRTSAFVEDGSFPVTKGDGFVSEEVTSEIEPLLLALSPGLSFDVDVAVEGGGLCQGLGEVAAFVFTIHGFGPDSARRAD